MRNLLILTVGLPRSGKSTWARHMAKEKGIPIVNPDSIRLALHGQVFCPSAEPMVWATAKLMVKALFLAGHHTVILDATNLTDDRRMEWETRDWDVRYKVFATAPEECIHRAMDCGRVDLIPVIERMASRIDPVPPNLTL